MPAKLQSVSGVPAAHKPSPQQGRAHNRLGAMKQAARKVSSQKQARQKDASASDIAGFVPAGISAHVVSWPRW